MGAVGTDTMDFGATPAEEATKIVTVVGLSPTSHIEAWFQHGDTTADNGIDEHEEAAALCPLVCKYLSATTFEAKAMPIAMLGLGQFKFHWTWSD
jgi:hypothetical protein